MLKSFYITIIISTLLYLHTSSVIAAETASSATLTTTTTEVCLVQDNRADKLTQFLKSKDSPLADYVTILITEADKNNLNYTLIPAITGVESSFGKAMPAGSFNAYGWGNGKIFFTSWEEGITKVAATLNLTYAQKWGATTPEEIGRYYAASPTWASRVNYNMAQIEAQVIEKETPINL